MVAEYLFKAGSPSSFKAPSGKHLNWIYLASEWPFWVVSLVESVGLMIAARLGGCGGGEVERYNEIAVE
jgi:hypothetical protein